MTCERGVEEIATCNIAFFFNLICNMAEKRRQRNVVFSFDGGYTEPLGRAGSSPPSVLTCQIAVVTPYISYD